MVEDDAPDDTTHRPIQNAKDTAARARDTVLSWLPSAKRCESCNVPCEATWRYSAQEAAFHAETNGEIPVYECPECDTAWRRERREGLAFSIWDREE